MTRATHAPAHATALRSEFDRQVETLLELGYPRLAGLSDAEFTEKVLPLRDRLADVPATADAADVDFVIVLDPRVVPPERCLPLVEHRARPGVVDMHPTEPSAFAPIDVARPPDGFAYLAYGIETGRDMLDVTPDDALPRILVRSRSPLTIQEGVAVLTHVPDVLRSLNAFSLLGSRSGDKRVPALWISKGRPRLGWCWAGNPHTWLGSASCAGRLAAA
jgi:hypothetical protein